MPLSAAKVSDVTDSGTENERIENRLRSSEGCSVRDSQSRKPARTATPNAIHA